MTLRARALVICLLALLAFAALAAAYAVACPFEAPLYEPEKWGEGNPAAPNLPQCTDGEPINCATGNQTEEQTDLALGGRGPGLHVTRTYNSQAATEATSAGAWGYGWSGPFSSHLEFNKESGAVTVVQENGAAAAFNLEGGKYVPGAWVQATLVKEIVESKEVFVFTLPTQEKLKFNSTGQLTEQKDRNGNAITFTYESGKLTKAKDSAGRELKFAYTGSQVTSVEDPLGRKVKYGYEASNLTSVTLPGEETARWKFKYDAFHQLTEMTNGRGGVTKTEYDEKHRAKKQTDPAERVLKFEYGESGGNKTTTTTEPNGSTTFEKFNEAGEPLEVVEAKGTGLERKTTDEYNAAYELVKSTDPLGHSTTYEYNAAGDMTLEKDPEGDETKRTYDATHDVETETTPKGEKTTYKRDSHGNVEAIERPAPGETTQKSTFKHASNGDLESATDPLGHETKFEYDTYGDLKAETDPEGDKTTWTFDKDGEQLTEVSPRGNEEGAKASEFESVTERDSQGRPKKITDPLGHETKLAYDKDGNLESVIDALGHATKYTYDADDERTKVEKANGDTTEIAYDSMGEVKSRTDGNGHSTKYERNALGEPTETIDPLERKSKREYDAAGNLKKSEDALGRTIAFSYDAANRLKEVNYSEEGTHDVTFKYDRDGNVVELTDGTGTTTKGYDQLDRLTEIKNGAKEVVKYDYNVGNQQTEITYPNGKTVKRAFDKAGRMDEVTDWLGNESWFRYNRDSQIREIETPGEVVDESFYNTAGELTELAHSFYELESEQVQLYTHDKDGQIDFEWGYEEGPGGKFEEGPEKEYGYDPANRLSWVNEEDFEYDKANNPTYVNENVYTYDKADEIATSSAGTFEFDKLGHRIKETPAGETSIPYAYDQAGNLISTKSGGVESSLKYDGAGLLASETANGSTYALTWDVSPELPLLLRSGGEYFIYGPEGLPVEQILTSSGIATFLHHDQLGSTRALTNEAGEVTGVYGYGPTGEVTTHSGAGAASIQFAGQYRMHTGKQLIYMRARTYDPSTAQFLTVDPALGRTGEPYGYATDNPINATDATGLDVDSFCLQGSVSAKGIASASVTACIAVDGHGNLAGTITVGGGGTVASGTVESILNGSVFQHAYSSIASSFDDNRMQNMQSTLSDLMSALGAQLEGSYVWVHSDEDTVYDLAGAHVDSSTSFELHIAEFVLSGDVPDDGGFSIGVGVRTGTGAVEDPVNVDVGHTTGGSYTWVYPKRPCPH
jgi:RHS repeat-associated protein